MVSQVLLGAVNRTKDIISDFGYKCASRQKPEYFSREGGKIGFKSMITITLNFLTKSVQTELSHFFERVLEKTEPASKQAYFDARHKLTVEAFRYLYKDTVAYASTLPNLATYKGYRPLAIDGSILQLENTIELRGYFGTSGGEKGSAAARVSVMTDVLNKGLIMDAEIDQLAIGEGKLAQRHIENLKGLQIEKPVLTFDRGYASANLIELLNEKDYGYLFRLKRKFSSEIDQMPLGDFSMDVEIHRRCFRLRVLKFRLTTGEIETLITNLPRKKITTAGLKELYHLRWGVETAYNVIKSALQIENFSGHSTLIVKQDFFATMFLKNMVTFAKFDTDEVIEQNCNSQNIYRHVTNINQLIGLLKDKLAMALLETDSHRMEGKIEAIILEAARYKTVVRPNRHFGRKRKHYKRFNASRKPAL